MSGKRWWQSKTLWTNLATILGAAGGAATGELPVEAAISAGVIAAVNAALRFTTKGPIQGAGASVPVLALLAALCLPGLAQAESWNREHRFNAGIVVPSDTSAKIHTIAESVPGAGVTIDGLLARDGLVSSASGAWCGNATCTEYGVGGVWRAVLSVDLSLTVTDAAAAGAHASSKLFTLPSGYVLFQGASADLDVACGTDGLTATATHEIGLGTSTAGTDNSALTAGEETILAGAAADLTDSAVTYAATNVTAALQDGTSAPVPVWLNLVFAADDASANDVCTVEGTVVLLFAKLGL